MPIRKFRNRRSPHIGAAYKKKARGNAKFPHATLTSIHAKHTYSNNIHTNQKHKELHLSAATSASPAALLYSRAVLSVCGAVLHSRTILDNRAVLDHRAILDARTILIRRRAILRYWAVILVVAICILRIRILGIGPQTESEKNCSKQINFPHI